MRVNSIILTSAVLCAAAVVPGTAQANQAPSSPEINPVTSELLETNTESIGVGLLTGEVHLSPMISADTLLVTSDRGPLQPTARRWKAPLSRTTPVRYAYGNATAGQVSWQANSTFEAAQPQPTLARLTSDLEGPRFSRKRPTGLASSQNLDSFLAAAERVLAESETSSSLSTPEFSTFRLSSESEEVLEAPVVVQFVDPQAVLEGLLAGSDTAINNAEAPGTNGSIAVTDTVERNAELGVAQNESPLVSGITQGDSSVAPLTSIESAVETDLASGVEETSRQAPQASISAVPVVESQDIIIAQSLPALEDVQQIQEQLRTLGGEEEASTGTRRRSFPSISIANPTGYGADRGEVFAGASFQSRTRFSGGSLFGGGRPDGAVGIGFGIGDARESVGLQLSYTAASFGGSRTPLSGGINAKLHKQFGNGSAAAIGGEGIINFGRLPRPRRNGQPAFNDFEGTYYGVFTHTFALRDYEQPFSRLSLTGGLGSGRFRSPEQIVNGEFDIGVFGSAALQVHPSTNVIAEWTGQDLGLGLSVAPFPNFPIVFTPAVRDLVGEGDGSPRFIFGVGMSLTEAIRAIGL